MRSTLLVVLIAITLIVFYKEVDVKHVWGILKMVELRFLFLGIACMLVFWVFEACMLDMLMQKLSGRRQLWTTIKMTIVGQYYSFITPFASGGQAAQLYIMQKDSIASSKGTVILASKFIIFQVTVTLYSLILVVWHLKTLIMTSNQISTFVFMGLTINTVGLTAIVMIALNPILLKKILRKMLYFLVRLKVMKDGKTKEDQIHKFTEEYLEGVEELKSDPLLTVYMLGLSILQLTAFFSITFFVYKGLGLSGVSAFRIISLQAMLYMAVSFVPIPGTIGASEAGFALLLGSVFHGHFLGAALLLWRVITYYFGLVFSGIFSLMVYFEERIKKSIITN